MAIGSSLKGDGLRARSIRSSLWTGLSFGASNLLRLGSNLILTRILFPEAFGIMALLQMVMAGLNMFSDIGIRAAIIQNERGDDPAFLDTAWILQILRGFVLFAFTWVLAAPVAAFYEVPELEQLLPVVGLVAVFQGFNSTKLAFVNRNLMLGRATAIEIGSNLVGLSVMVGLALAWESVWALAVGGLVGPFVFMLASHLVLTGHQNRLRFEKAAAGTLISFGKFIFFSTLAAFLLAQADRAILGKFVSLSDLALYNIAFMFASLPLMLMRRMTDMVLLPIYSRKPPADSLENYRNLAKARWLVLGPVMALLSVLAIFGNQLIVALYDPRYEPAGILVVLIAVASSALVVSGGYGSAILASGNSRMFSNVVISSALLRTAILGGAIYFYGVLGAVAAPLIATVLFYPVLVAFIRPYRAWLPLQDSVLSVSACTVAAVALWYNWEVLGAAIDMFGAAILIRGE